MRQGLYIAAALIAGALLANFLLADPGYFALRFAGRLVEMSAVTFALVSIGIYFLIRLVAKAIEARRLWQSAQDERRHSRARRGLARGLLEMAEGEWVKSESTLVESAREAETPTAHYLVAARAADLQGATQRRDEWLAKALEVSADRRAPALVMQAEGNVGTARSQRRAECSRPVTPRASAAADWRLGAAAGHRASSATDQGDSRCAGRRDRSADLFRPAEGGRLGARSEAAGGCVAGHSEIHETAR
jgi:hypothetical protein